MIDKRKPSWWYMLNPLVRRKSNRSNRGITVDGTDCEGPIPTDEAGYIGKLKIECKKLVFVCRVNVNYNSHSVVPPISFPF